MDAGSAYGADDDRYTAKSNNGEDDTEGSSPGANKGTPMTYNVVFEEVSQRTGPAKCTRQVVNDEQTAVLECSESTQHHIATVVPEKSEQCEREETGQGQTNRYCVDKTRQKHLTVLTYSDEEVETGTEAHTGQDHRRKDQDSNMSNREPADRDSTGPLGPRDGRSSRFNGLEARGVSREAYFVAQEEAVR